MRSARTGRGAGDVVSGLNSVVGTALAEPAIQEKLRKLGNTPAAPSPAAVRTLIADTIAKWTAVIDETQIERTWTSMPKPQSTASLLQLIWLPRCPPRSPNTPARGAPAGHA